MLTEVVTAAVTSVCGTVTVLVGKTVWDRASALNAVIASVNALLECNTDVIYKSSHLLIDERRGFARQAQELASQLIQRVDGIVAYRWAQRFRWIKPSRVDVVSASRELRNLADTMDTSWGKHSDMSPIYASNVRSLLKLPMR